MAKGGISLNPGADPTLVRAATYAAMANVPKDLSGTFEAMATNYAATMKIVGETWAGVAKIGGELAGEAISIYAQNKKYDAMGIGIQNKDGTSFLYDQLQKTRQGLKDTWFNPVTTDADGNPLENWRDLNRAKRLEFRQDKAKLEAQIVDLNNGYNNLATRLETGDYHQAATGNGNWRMINAVGAYKSSSGKTKDGDYVLPDMDENGDVFFTLYGSDGKEVKSKDGENVTVKAGEIEGLLTPKNDTVISNANKLFLNLEASGKIKGRNYGMDGKVFRKNFGKLLENEDDMHILMNEDLYMLGRSFTNDVNNGDLEGDSFTSANIWSSMGGILPTDSKGKPLQITDSNNSGGIDAGDFQNVDNYNKLAGAILDRTNKFYNKDVTKAIFQDWAHQSGEKAFRYGAGMRTGDSNGGRTRRIGDRDVSAEVWQGDYVPYINFLNNPKEGQKVMSPRGGIAEYKGGEWYWEGDKSTLDHIAKTDYITNYVTGTTGTTKSPTTVTPIIKGQKIDASTKIGKYTLGQLFSDELDDDDVGDLISQAFPNLQVDVPTNPFKERIKVEGIAYDVDDEADMRKLLEFLNSEAGQNLLSEDPLNPNI